MIVWWIFNPLAGGLLNYRATFAGGLVQLVAGCHMHQFMYKSAFRKERSGRVPIRHSFRHWYVHGLAPCQSILAMRLWEEY